MPHVCWSAVDGELKRLVAFGKFVSDWICPRKLSALRSNGAVNATVRVSERDGKAGGGQCGFWHVDDKVRKSMVGEPWQWRLDISLSTM